MGAFSRLRGLEISGRNFRALKNAFFFIGNEGLLLGYIGEGELLVHLYGPFLDPLPPPSVAGIDGSDLFRPDIVLFHPLRLCQFWDQVFHCWASGEAHLSNRHRLGGHWFLVGEQLAVSPEYASLL